MVLTLIAFAQRTSRPPQDPSKKKTEFRHSFFRADYLVSKTLTRFLEQDKTMIDVEATKLKVTAADLYYDKSSDYKLERDIYPWIKNKYLVSDDRQIELLDSVLNLNKKWKNAIIEQGVLEEIMNPINGKYKFRVENKAIYALSSRSQNGYNQNIYKFDLCGVCWMYLLSSHTIFHTIHNKVLFLCVGIYKRNNINRTSSFCHHLLDIKLVQFIAKQKVKEASN